MGKLAVIRVRGDVDVREEVKDVLHMLCLTRPNHCTLVDDDPSQSGMLQKVKEMVTWGPIKPEVLEELLRKRGELVGGKSVTNEVIKKSSSYKTVEEFAEAVCEGDGELSEVEQLKKVLRLPPPKKGYNPTRRSFQHGGAVGNRGEEINDLISRMM